MARDLNLSNILWLWMIEKNHRNMLKYEDDVSGAEKLAIDIEEANQKHLQHDAKTTF